MPLTILSSALVGVNAVIAVAAVTTVKTAVIQLGKLLKNSIIRHLIINGVAVTALAVLSLTV